MKANRLRPGDTIGIASPSWGGPAVFPHRLENGIAYLESRGFRVRVAAHARGQDGPVSGTAAERTADLHDLFCDPDVRRSSPRSAEITRATCFPTSIST
jgi:muramoyltetrapeptide carboxypeptidase